MQEVAVLLRDLLLPGASIEGDLAVTIDLKDTRLRVVRDAADLAERTGLGIAVVADDEVADEAGILEVEGGGHDLPDVLVLGHGGR